MIPSKVSDAMLTDLRLSLRIALSFRRAPSASATPKKRKPYATGPDVLRGHDYRSALQILKKGENQQ